MLMMQLSSSHEMTNQLLTQFSSSLILLNKWLMCFALSFIYLIGQLGDTYLFLVLRDSLVFRESGVKTVITPT